MLLRFLPVAALIFIGAQAEARWKPEYAAYPPEVQEWYRQAELTHAAQARFPFKKCCEHADVVKTKFNVNRTTHGDEWYWLDNGSWRRIPDDIIHWGENAPAGGRRCSSTWTRRPASSRATAASDRSVAG